MFRMTATASWMLVAARSGRPSPLKSRKTKEPTDSLPIGKLSGGLNPPWPSPRKTSMLEYSEVVAISR